MEIKFQSKNLRSLCCCTDKHQTQEQTQEVRLPDGMPDIERVLTCWGRPVIRGKEWQNGAMSVSGGVMVWLLYAPEGGSEPRSVQTWIPFQMRWEFPQTRHDGYIFVVPGLKSLDARSTSPRKMMIRANISVWGRGLVGEDTQIYSPEQIPTDVELLQSDYPMQIPMEAGEVPVHLDETFELKNMHPVPEQILKQDISTCITEQRVMASRLVFRGKGKLDIVYLSGGKIYTAQQDFSFSQYADLDGEYSQAACAQVVSVVTNLELDQGESALTLKCDLAAQYVIFDRVMIQLTEDAYSNLRPVTLENTQLQLQRLLDRRTEELHFEQAMQLQAERIADISCLYELPRQQQTTENSELLIPMQLQVLYYDPEGKLQSSQTRVEHCLPMLSGGDVTVNGIICGGRAPEGIVSGQQVDIRWDVNVDTAYYAQDGQWMVSAVGLGELQQPDPARASVILRRFDRGTLWDTAKSCGSTVAAIRSANHLESEPEYGKMLLIPVS